MIRVSPEKLKDEVQEIDGVGEATAEKILDTARGLDEPVEFDTARAKRYLKHGKERDLLRMLKELD